MSQTKTINGILLLYHYPLAANAPTVMEHVRSFPIYSQFRVWTVNTALGFPATIAGLRFRAIVLHYSLFDPKRYALSVKFLSYLEQHEASYRIAFFQDEHHFCQQRFAFLNRYHIDCVYTLLDPAHFQDVYHKYTSVPRLVPTLTGYVSDDLSKKAEAFARPGHARRIDIGYRGRRLAFYMGRGSQEKYEIALRFRQAAAGYGLKIDVETQENKRLYGDAWYRFLGDCKACLGVEAGVSIFDIKDVVRQEYDQLIADNPGMTFEEMSERLLSRWEGNMPYRTISPRHFEAAAFRVCQILYQGEYQGILKPMVHYIPLRKDFSNFDQVISLFHDDDFRHQITENCYRDLIASGRYTYREFVHSFDQELLKAGLDPKITPDQAAAVSAALRRDRPRRCLISLFRRALLFFGRPIATLYFRVPPLARTYRLVIRWLER